MAEDAGNIQATGAKSLEDPDHPENVNTMVNRMGIYMIPILSLAVYWVNASWWWTEFGDYWAWGEEGLHPYMMSASYLVISPLAVVSFRLFRDMLGFSHTVAKIIHAFLQTAAGVIAVLGIITMHMQMSDWGDDQWGATHGMLGLLVVTLWWLQIVLGISIFLMPCSPKWLRAAYHQLHMVFGACLAFTVIMVAVMGIVWQEIALDTYGGAESTWIAVWQSMKAGVILIALLTFAMYFALYRAPAPRS